MPTIDQIQSQSTSALTALEKEIVRHVIGINGVSSSDVYTDSESRMASLTPVQNQLVRALITEYENIDNATTAIYGGNDGLDVSFNRDRTLIASQMRRILYPTDINDPAYNDGTSTSGSLNFVPVTYGVGSAEFD